MDVYQMVSAMIDAGISQSQLAREVESTQPTIRRIQNKTTSPNYELAKRIEARFHEFQQEKQQEQPAA